MKQYSLVTIALFGLIALSLADELTPEPTITFGSTDYHIPPEFDNVAKGALAGGYAVLGVVFIFCWIRIWIDEYQRH